MSVQLKTIEPVHSAESTTSEQAAIAEDTKRPRVNSGSRGELPSGGGTRSNGTPFELCNFENPSSTTMQPFAIRSLRVTSSVPAKSFAQDFLKSAKVLAAGTSAGALPYLNSLARFCEIEAKDLAITSTAYEFTNPSHSIELYDIKCRARFEDDMIERMYREWPSQSGLSSDIVCPLRRGVCVGLLDNKDLILAVGNAKFYYGTEEEILAPLKKSQDSGTVLLTEKANGEYTLMSSSKTTGETRWLTVGSKNVRLCLPYIPGKAFQTKSALENIVFAFNHHNANKEEGHRFSYIRDMLDLWLRGIESDSRVLKELEQGATLIGEQVGVHAHIFTGYKSAHIRLFALLPWAKLHSDFACDLKDLKRRLFSAGTSSDKTFTTSLEEEDEGEERPLSLVRAEEFKLPEERLKLIAKLGEIASGSMQVYGEGVVAYVYSPLNNACLDLFKFKCEEYAFDRRLRTVLSRLAGELHRNSGAQMTRLKLQSEAARLDSELKKSASTQFTRMDRARVQSRIEMVPAMVAFLERHQATVFCEDFSEHFVDFLKQVEAEREEYARLAKDTFLKAFDPMDAHFSAFLDQFSAVHVPFRNVQSIADELYGVFQNRGGFAKFQCIGVAAMPGGGKTAILRALLAKFEQSSVPVKLCDRDAYVIADPSMRGDLVHKIWVEDISNAVHSEKKVCLVGNTFTGTFADKLEAQTKTRVLLFVLKEATHVQTRKHLVPVKKATKNGTCDPEDSPRCRAALFNLECLRRLRNRTETFSDGSTLSMGLGAKIVLEKFFASQPEERMLERRVKQQAAYLVECIPQTSFDYKSAMWLAEALSQLKNQVASGGQLQKKAAVEEETVPEEEKFNRTLYSRASVDYVKRGGDSAFDSIAPKTKFTGLGALADCAKRLSALARVELFRTDCHVTLSYAPSIEDMRAFIRNFDSVQEIHAPILARVTLFKTHKNRKHTLQFLVLGDAREESIRRFMPAFPHVTLGSTNPNVLPHAKSGEVLQELVSIKALSIKEPYGQAQSEFVQLKDGVEAQIEAIAGEEFVGTPSFFYISKAA